MPSPPQHQPQHDQETSLARIPAAAAVHPDAPLSCVVPTPTPRWAQWLSQRLLRFLQLSTDSIHTLHKLAERGTIIYVLRQPPNWFIIPFLLLLQRWSLPTTRFVGGPNMGLWHPLHALKQWWHQRRQPTEVSVHWQQAFDDLNPTRHEQALAEHLCAVAQTNIVRPAELSATATTARAGAVLGLLPPHQPGSTRSQIHDFYRAVVAAQRHLPDHHFWVVPVALTRRERPRIGANRLSHLVATLRALRHTSLRVGQPLDVQTLSREHNAQEPQLVARRMRHELARRIEGVERAIGGPRIPRYERTAKRVLRDSWVRDALAQTSRQTQQTVALLERTAANQLKHIAARYRIGMVRFLSKALNLIFNRIYDGLVVDTAGLQPVIQASASGPLIFCPSHRSHIDYLALSWCLWQQGLTPPHIAAGANLAFFPMGTVFRSAGAFFLRRTFRGDPLYAAVFRAYVAELLRSGTNIEFFLEGTRSRTGKMLPPKFGLLHMIVDAWRRGMHEDIHFVPVAIDYERIIEANAYRSELGGAAKKREDWRAVLRSSKVLLSRYGRVHLQFGKPISLRDVAAQANLAQNATPDIDSEWRQAVAWLGQETLYRVTKATSVTPTAIMATVLLSQHQQSTTREACLRQCLSLLEHLRACNARMSSLLKDSSQGQTVLQRAFDRLVEDGSLVESPISQAPSTGETEDKPNKSGEADNETTAAQNISYELNSEHRSTLAYHKNTIINYFAPQAMLCRAILCAHQAPHAGPGPTELVLPTAQAPQVTATCAQVDASMTFLADLWQEVFYFPQRDPSSAQKPTTPATQAAAVQSLTQQTIDHLMHAGILAKAEEKSLTLNTQGIGPILAHSLDPYCEAFWVATETLRDLRAFPLWRKELLTRSCERLRQNADEKRCRAPEAANEPQMREVLKWLERHGVCTLHADKRQSVTLTEVYQEHQALDALVEQLRRYVL